MHVYDYRQLGKLLNNINAHFASSKQQLKNSYVALFDNHTPSNFYCSNKKSLFCKWRISLKFRLFWVYTPEVLIKNSNLLSKSRETEQFIRERRQIVIFTLLRSNVRERTAAAKHQTAGKRKWKKGKSQLFIHLFHNWSILKWLFTFYCRDNCTTINITSIFNLWRDVIM